MGESAQSYGDEENRNNSNGAATPTFFSFAENKRQSEKSQNGQDRADEQRGSFHFRGKQREQCVNPEEEIVGTRSGLNDGGIGTSGWTEGTEVSGNEGKRDKNTGAEENVFVNGGWHEGDAVRFDEFVILLLVSGFTNDATGHRPFVDAELQHHEEVKSNEGKEQAGNHENMKGKKTREGGTGNNRAAEKEMDGPGSHHRNTAGDGCANADAPESILIETKNLAGKRHTEGHEQKKYANDPGEFSRIFVGTK